MPAIDRAKRAMRGTPLEQPARAALQARHIMRVRRALSHTSRREHIDNLNLHLLMAFTLREDASCVDVGASVGDILDAMVRLAPQGHHVAFEPIESHAVSLRARFPQVILHQAAVSDRSETTTFQINPDALPTSSLRGRPGLDSSRFQQTTV